MNTITTDKVLVGGIEVRITRDGQGVTLEEAAQALADAQNSISRTLQDLRGGQITTIPISDALRAFKAGDVVTYEVSDHAKGITAIAKRYNEGAKVVEFFSILDQDGRLCVEDEECYELLENITKIRLATDDERKRLTGALRDERCLMWDWESKSLVRWRTGKVDMSTRYAHVNGSAEVQIERDTKHAWDNNRYTLGNYYPTREMAERQAERIRAIHATPCTDEQDA